MSRSNNVHSASGPFAGYLFQIERVLYWLSQSDVEIVALETEDDIVASFKGTRDAEKILEQAKHSISEKVPLSDSSLELWKTLSIWVERNDDTSKVYYSLVTNKPLPSNRLIKRIVASKNDQAEFKKLINALLEIGKVARKTIKPFANKVLACPFDRLADIFGRVELYFPDNVENTKDIKKFVRSNLGIGNDLPIDLIYRELLGYLTELIITKWRNGETFTLERETILGESNKITARYVSKTFVEKTIDLLPVDKEDIEKHKCNRFVEQLIAIGCDETEIIDAIGHYLRSKAEKSRYAFECNILESKFTEYYRDLKENWTAIFNPTTRLKKGTPSEQVGYEVYYETLKYRGSLDGQVPEQTYTFKGAYHHLSNIPELGWHPDWKKKFK